MAQLSHTSSTDILFPEDEPSQSGHEDSFCSPHSTAASYSTYSHEVKYIFEPQYAHSTRSDYSDISAYDARLDNENDREAQDSVSEIYTPPRIRTHPARVYRNNTYSDSYSASKDSIASRRKTWSPPTCNRMMGSASSSFSNQGNAVRNFHSNDQLDVDNGNYYEELNTLPPPKLPPVSGMLNNRVGVLG